MIIVSTGKIIAKNTVDLVSGKIQPEKFVKNIGKEGVLLANSVVGSEIGAVVGTALLPGVGTVVGSVIGGMIASMMSDATFNQLQQTLQENKLSDEKRKIVEEYCLRLIEQEKAYRNQVIAVVSNYLDCKEQEFSAAFNALSVSIKEGTDLRAELGMLSDSLNLDVEFFDQRSMRKMIETNQTLRL
jgi:hypothetical protein